MEADKGKRTIKIACKCLYDREKEKWNYDDSALPEKVFELGISQALREEG